MSTIQTILVQDMARYYIEAGLSVVPIRPDGSKSATVEWKPFQTRIASPEEVRSMFRDGVGIGIIAGPVSGNLEVLDIEAAAAFQEFCELIREHDARLLDELVHVATPSGGHHLLYRCDEISGSQKLASHFDEHNHPKVDFETRGTGAYVVTVGSPPACHIANKPYRLIKNRLTQIPKITPAQRALLLDAARSFNRVVKPAQVDRKPATNGNGNGNGNGARPGDVLNSQATWAEIIEPHGWRPIGGRGEETLWRRPGKDFSFSATTNYKGSDLFYCFSTNGYPFESETSYSKFAAYALLNHGGDYRAAARAIAQRYGLKDERKTAQVVPIRRELDEERQAIQQEASPAPEQSEEAEHSYIEFSPQFLSVEDPPIRYLINELLPEQVICLMHGEPRTRKSWAALEIAIALATGTPAFNLERFRVDQPVPVLYTSQEDAARDVRLRANAILAGRGLDRFPETLAFAVHKGIDLESAEWHERLIRDVTRYGFRYVALDPIRRYGLNVDKGPAEVRATTAYLRRLVIETGTVPGLVHHDVKPPASGPDARRRSHKASGGDWFAASECPIAFEVAGEVTLAYPEDYKFSIDPQPFSFRLETDDPKHPKVARLVGEDASTGQAAEMVVHEKVVAYLAEHPGASGSALAKGCRIRKEAVLTALNQLELGGKVDSVKTDKAGRKTGWFLRKNAQ